MGLQIPPDTPTQPFRKSAHGFGETLCLDPCVRRDPAECRHADAAAPMTRAEVTDSAWHAEPILFLFGNVLKVVVIIGS
jgi:hypothetical protein